MTFIVALVAAQGSGQAATLSGAGSVLARTAIDQERLKSLPGRATLAAAVRVYCDEVGQSYPRNSPKEDDWLDGEIRAGGDRTMRVLASPEWGRRQAQFFTEACARYSADLDKTPDRSKLFVALAYTFVRFAGDAEYFASKNGLDAERLGFPVALRMTTEALLVAALQAGQ